MTVTPSGIIAQTTLDGRAVPQATRAQRIALSILQGERLFPVEIGRDGFAQRLDDASCGCCGGFFPKVGEARYSATFHEYLHTGCVVDAPSWAHPLVPIRRCTDAACVEGWTTSIDPSYSALDRAGEGSLGLRRCPSCNGDGAA